MEQTYVPHPPSPSVPMVPIQPFDMPTTPEARRSEDGGSSRRDSPSAVELTRSRENSMHNGEGALSNMTREMQLALYPMFMCEDRHESADLGREPPGTSEELVSKWRMKDRMKTMSVALILCLNIGVDPPDVLKISPCARMQCWINPLSMQPQKALDAIGKALQAQYERWQPRAKYKLQLDPTVEDVKKLCVSCRRNAKNERVLLHYNGHGVPRPTVNGEVWVFNKSYTQYIPLSIYDLQAWTGNPAIYVFDCSGAGLVVNSFLQLAQHGGGSGSSGSNGSVMGTGAAAAALNAASAAARRETGEDTMGGAMPLGSGMNEVILLAACGAEELLPQSAELPADLFSACLTTPIKIALQWFCSRSILKGHSINPDIIDKIPGQQNNRKTPLGELNWIFTAITDTIAWNVLPRPLFQRLFRQDLLVASLFRNFLLADRIMRANNCTPISCPALPPTYQHPMWHAWDMAVEICLLQMPALISGDPAVEFTPSPFFTEQLTAFEVWLEHGSEQKPPPEQLPIVLQVLLSQSHRLRALVLLGRFLDMGPWAVDLALSVGIFPYVLKLLQTTAPDLRQILVFIWTKILALDRSCQQDLVKDNSHVYFIRFLDSPQVPSEERAMAAFVLAAIADDHPKGQAVCASSGLLHICLNNLPAAASPAAPPSSSAGSACAWANSGRTTRRYRRRRSPRAPSSPSRPSSRIQPRMSAPPPSLRSARSCEFPMPNAATPAPTATETTTTPAKTSPGSTQTNASPPSAPWRWRSCRRSRMRRRLFAPRRRRRWVASRGRTPLFSNPPRRGRDGTRGRDRRRREANPSAPRDTSDRVRPWDRSPWRR